MKTDGVYMDRGRKRGTGIKSQFIHFHVNEHRPPDKYPEVKGQDFNIFCKLNSFALRIIGSGCMPGKRSCAEVGRTH